MTQPGLNLKLKVPVVPPPVTVVLGIVAQTSNGVHHLTLPVLLCVYHTVPGQAVPLPVPVASLAASEAHSSDSEILVILTASALAA